MATNTNGKELFRAIESDRFSALLNVVSGYRSFTRAVEQQPEVQQLRSAMRQPDVQLSVFVRLVQLLTREPDPKLENRNDVAVAVYIWSLTTLSSPLASVAAALVAQRHDFWWARKVAERVVPFGSIPTESGSSISVLGDRPHLIVGACNTKPIGYVVFGGRRRIERPPAYERQVFNEFLASEALSMGNRELFRNRNASNLMTRHGAMEFV